MSSSHKSGHISIDFETYYDDICSVSKLATYNYTRHPDFTAYLVAIYAEDFRYVGDIDNAPWEKLDGSRPVVAHNSMFEIAVIRWGKRNKKIPLFVTEIIQDTAAVCRFLNVAGALSGAMKGLYKEDRSKAIRDQDMKGKLPSTMSPELWEGVKAYGLQDAEDCWRIWDDFSGLWPQVERDVWWHSFRMLDRGIHVDIPKLEHYIDELGRQYHGCIQEMPWVEEGAKPGSPKAVRELCRKLGIEIPTSFNKTQPDVKRWIKENSHHDWVKAFIDHKSINQFRNKLLNMQNRIDDKGVLRYDLIYGGTRTLRWAGSGGEGSGGWNALNQRRGSIFGCDERSLLVPPPGKKFAILDYSQIEPRVIFTTTNNQAALDLIASGMSPYEAYARITNQWTRKEPLNDDTDSSLYKIIKAEVLSLGYAVGHKRFAEATGMSLERAKELVIQYRYRDNVPVVRRWSEMEADMKAYRGCDVYRQELPSGRPIYYHNIAIDSERGNIVVPKELGYPRREWYYGGKIFQNSIQAIARDVLRDNALLETEKQGVDCHLHIYDEGAFSIDKGSPKAEADQAEEISRMMCKTLDWMPELPLEADYKICDCYTK